MDRRFDPDHIAGLATKVGQLKDAYNTAGKDLGDGNPGSAYGGLSNAASASETMRGFYSAVNGELDAAVKLVDAASRALAEAAERMRNDEDHVVRTLGGDPERLHSN